MADTFLGQSITDMVNQTNARYFYGLRRTDDGELFIAKVDQLKSNESIIINKEGDPAQNYEDFDEGENFLEGRNVLIYSFVNLTVISYKIICSV